MPINQLNNGDSGLTARTIINELVDFANSGSVDTGSFATTGSNAFFGNQTFVNQSGTGAPLMHFPSGTFIYTSNESGSLFLSAINEGTLYLNSDGGEGNVQVGYNGWNNKLVVKGDQTISGSIDFGDGSQIQSISASSGDGYGYATLEIKPDATLNTDQYIVLDPTSPNHIHIRAGGTIDSSSAYLYLGGEYNNVLIDDTAQKVYITSVNATNIIGSLEQGLNVLATGSYSHAEGSSTQAIGLYSHAEGESTIASGSFQHVSGKYNTHGDDTSLFIIGNGADDNNRSDIVRVTTTDVQVTGSLIVTGSQVYLTTDDFTIGLPDTNTRIDAGPGGVSLYDGNTVLSVSSGDRLLYKSDGAIVFDWENGIISSSLDISGSATISNVLTLAPQDPLPSGIPTGSFAVSASVPPVPYFWDGSNWNALY